MDQRQNSAIYINRNLHNWAKGYCEENEISFSRFVESYLIQLRDEVVKPNFNFINVEFKMQGPFKPHEKRNASLYIDGDLEAWCRRYCADHLITFGQLIESFLINWHSERKGYNGKL
jgi:hypothetical protein